MKKCPKCNRACYDTWNICPDCNVPLTEGGESDFIPKKSKGVIIFGVLFILIGATDCIGSLVALFFGLEGPPDIHLNLLFISKALVGLLSFVIGIAITLFTLRNVWRKLLIFDCYITIAVRLLWVYLCLTRSSLYLGSIFTLIPYVEIMALYFFILPEVKEQFK